MHQYTIEPEAQGFLRFLAEARHANDRKAGVKNNRIGPQSDEATDLGGIGGEYAFCQLFGAYFDASVTPRKGGFDCLSRYLRRIDVKATEHENGKLLAVITKQKGECDCFALMVGTFPTYRFGGWVWEGELLDKKNITDLGYGPTYALPQDRLKAPRNGKKVRR